MSDAADATVTDSTGSSAADDPTPPQSLAVRMARIAKERGIPLPKPSSAPAPETESLSARMARVAKERGLSRPDVGGDIDLRTDAPSNRFRLSSVGLSPTNDPVAPTAAPPRAVADATAVAVPSPIVPPTSGVRPTAPGVLTTSLRPIAPKAPTSPVVATPAPQPDANDGSTYRRVIARGGTATPPATAPDASRVNAAGHAVDHRSIEDALTAGLSDMAKPSPESIAPTSRAGKVVYAVGSMAAHPLETTTSVVTAPLQAAYTLGRFSRQSLEQARGNAPTDDVVTPHDAAFAAGQLLAIGATSKILPVLDQVFGEQMAKATVDALNKGESPTKALVTGYAARTATHAAAGAAVGATFAPDDPTTGAILGAALGGVHAASQAPHVTVPNGATASAEPAPVERQLAGQRAKSPSATARVVGMSAPDATEPDYTVDHVAPATTNPAAPDAKSNSSTSTDVGKVEPTSTSGPRPYVPESSGLHVTEEQLLTRNIARGLKTAHPDAIAHAAPEMAERVPPDAVLVPLPDHTGSTVANAALADAIAAQHPNADVADVLGRSTAVANSDELRQAGKPGVSADEHEASMVANGEVPKGKPVVFIDNVETTGSAAEGARRVLGRPDAQLVAFAKAPIPAGETAAVPKPATLQSTESSATSSATSAPTETPATTEASHAETDTPAQQAAQPVAQPTGGAAADDEAGSGRVPARTASAEGTQPDTERASGADAPSSASNDASTVAPLADRTPVPGPVGRDEPVHFSDGSSVNARYRVVEAEHLEPSHDPMTFAANPRYPVGVQGREYAGSRGKSARQHVELETGKLRSAPLLDAGGGTTDGPPLITPHGVTVAGNQRAMMLRRAASMAPDRFAAYRADLEARASQFGLDPKQIRAMKAPVLVREITDHSVDTNDTATLSRLNQLSDRPPTKSKDALSDALGRAKHMQQAEEALQHFSDTIDVDDSIREYLSTGAGGQFLRKLMTDGVIAPQERGAFLNANGTATEAGKDAIEAALRVAALGDPDIIHRAPPSIMRKLESAIPAIVQANATKTYALMGDLQGALDLLSRVDAMKADLQAKGSKVESFGVANYLEQQDAFGHQVEPAVAQMASFLERAPKALVTETLREYTKHALAGAEAAQSEDMFGHEPETKSGLSSRLLRTGERGRHYDPRQMSLWKLSDEQGGQIDIAKQPIEPTVAATPEQHALIARIVDKVREIGLPTSEDRRAGVRGATAIALIDPVGRLLQTPADAAHLMQAFRHPAMEILHAFVKSPTGLIVGHIMSSSGELNWSAVPRHFVSEIAALAHATRGVTVTLGHNHPSGDPRYSQDDLMITAQLADDLGALDLEVDGHIIIDHDRAQWLEVSAPRADGTPRRSLAAYMLDELTPDAAPWRTAPEAGYPNITSPERAASYFMALHEPGAVTLAMLDAQHRVVAIAPKLASAMADLHMWLPAEMAAHAAGSVMIMAGRDLAPDIADRVGLAQRSTGTDHEWADRVLDVFAVDDASEKFPSAFESYAQRGVVRSRYRDLAPDIADRTVRLQPGRSATEQVRLTRDAEATDARGRLRPSAGNAGESRPVSATGGVGGVGRVSESLPSTAPADETPGSRESGDRVSGTDQAPPETTGIKNAVNRSTRDALEMEPRRRPEPRTQQQMYDAGKAAADADPTAIPRLLTELRENPEKIVGTATEAGLLLKHRVDLENKLKELIAARDTAIASRDEEAERLARLQLAAHREEIREFVGFAERTGTASARALAARRMMSTLDYSLSHMEAMAEAAKGSALTQHELARVKALHDELQEKLAAVQKDLADANERAAAAEADLAHAQLRATAMKPLMDRVSSSLESAADAAKKRLRARGLRAMAGIDPADLADYAVIGAAAIAKGTVRFTEWSKQMTASLGDDVAPHLRAIFDASNQRLNMELKRARALESRRARAKQAEEAEEGEEGKTAPTSAPAPGETEASPKPRTKRLRKIGVAPAVEPADEEADEEAADTEQEQDPSGEPQTPRTRTPRTPEQLAQALKARLDGGESMASLRPYLRQLALHHIRAGILDREPLLDALYKDVLETGASMTRKQVRDILSGYGEFRPLDKAADKTALRSIQGEAQKLAQLEALQRGESPLATGFERQSPSDEARKLTKQVNDAKKAAGLQPSPDDATRLRTALASAKTRLRNRIADLRTEIDTGERAVRGKHVLIGDAELEALRAELTELRKAEVEAFGKSGLTDQQRLAVALRAAQRNADQWAERVEMARKGQYPTPGRARLIGNAELEALRAKAAAARDEYQELKAADPEQQVLADQRSNAQYRARLSQREAELLDRLARGDYSPRPLRPGTRLDSESLKRKADVEEVKQRYQQEIRRFERANRPPLEKARQAGLGFVRAGALSWPSVILKLTSVALSRVVTTPLTDLAALGIANALPKLAAGAPRYGTRSLRAALEAEAAGQSAMWTEGLRDAGRLLANKQSRLALAHSKDSMPHEWYEYFGSLHAALKEPIKRAEYARALYRGTLNAIANGENVTDAVTKLRLSTEAYLHAQRAVSMNDNVLVSSWNAGLRRLEQKDKATGKANSLGVLLSTAAHTDMPVVKAPTNVILEAGEFIAGLPLGAARAAWSYAHGIEDLKPVERDSILRMLSKGLVGAAIMALYFYKHDQLQFGGFYEPGEKRKPDDVPADALRIGSRTLPKNLLHNPLFMAGQYAASIARVAPTRVHPRDEDPVGYGSALVAASVGLLDEVPIIGSLVSDGRQIEDPRQRDQFLQKKIASIAVPGMVQWIATHTDSGDVPRKPVGLLQHIEANVPGLRRDVPVDEHKVRRLERLSANVPTTGTP